MISGKCFRENNISRIYMKIHKITNYSNKYRTVIPIFHIGRGSTMKIPTQNLKQNHAAVQEK